MLNRRTRLIYGSGGAVSGIKEAAFSVFVLLYYTQVLGLSGTQAGLALFIAIVWDVVSDPLVGAWSDRLKSRWGRRHPFMAISIIPLGLGVIALFAPPPAVAANNSWLFYWLVVSVLWIRTAYTFFWIPYSALGNELTQGYHERNILFGNRTTFLFISVVTAPALAYYLIFPTIDGVDGRFVEENYLIYGIVSCLMIWLIGFITVWGTRVHIPKLLKNSHKAPNSPGISGMLKELASTLSNRNFRHLLGFDVASSIGHGIFVTLNVLALTYFWEFSANEVGILLSGSTFVAVGIGLFTLRPLGEQFAKHQLVSFAVIGLVLDTLWLYPMRWLDLLPENGHPAVFFAVFIHATIWMYCYVLRVVSTTSMMADIVDEHELSHKVRQEGSFSAAASFTIKLAAGVGPLIGGPVLDIIGLSKGMMPGEVPAETLNSLALFIMAWLIPLLLISLWFCNKIDMTADKLAGIQRKIKERDELTNTEP